MICVTDMTTSAPMTILNRSARAFLYKFESIKEAGKETKKEVQKGKSFNKYQPKYLSFKDRYNHAN